MSMLIIRFCGCKRLPLIRPTSTTLLTFTQSHNQKMEMKNQKGTQMRLESCYRSSKVMKPRILHESILSRPKKERGNNHSRVFNYGTNNNLADDLYDSPKSFLCSSIPTPSSLNFLHFQLHSQRL